MGVPLTLTSYWPKSSKSHNSYWVSNMPIMNSTFTSISYDIINSQHSPTHCRNSTIVFDIFFYPVDSILCNIFIYFSSAKILWQAISTPAPVYIYIYISSIQFLSLLLYWQGKIVYKSHQRSTQRSNISDMGYWLSNLFIKLDLNLQQILLSLVKIISFPFKSKISSFSFMEIPCLQWWW